MLAAKNLLYGPPHGHDCIYHYLSNASCGALVGMEENILFNDALNTFYLWLYGIGNMVKKQIA